MNVMYIMPRYHTNLVPTMSGWIENGDEVTIITHTKGAIEDYSLLEPIVAGYSPVFMAFQWIYEKVLRKGAKKAKDMALKCGFPSIFTIKRMIKKHDPDVVILREKSIYSIVCTAICRSLGVQTLMYNQSPLWIKDVDSRNDFMHRIVDGLTPSKRITPVNACLTDKGKKKKDDAAVFAPFVMKGNLSPKEKKYFVDGNIHILEIGKYDNRKNHLMMVDAFQHVFQEKQDIRLTIIGEKSFKSHMEYFSELEKYIDEKNLKNYISLKYNLTRDLIAQEYRNTDIFVLPSTKEPAAISPIEAMSYSIPVISSSGNGTADYVIDGNCGFIFQDMDIQDLQDKISELVSSREKIMNFGSNAYNRILDYCSFEKYYKAVGIAIEKRL